MDSLEDSTRVVVGESRHGGVLPGSRAEMWRDVFLLPGADVRGPVFGNAVSAEGPDVCVRESVYARGPVRVTPAEKPGRSGADVSFEGCVTTPDAVQVAPAAFRTRFRANVYAGTIHLDNAIVYGNIYARSAVIRNSVILGGAFIAGRLTLSDSIVSTFHARAARLDGTVSLLFPVALSDDPIQLAGQLRVLSFFGLDPESRGEAGKESGVVPIDADDIYRVESRLADDELRAFHMISVDPRILDTQPLMRSLRANRRAIEGLSMLGHLSEDDAATFLGCEPRCLEDALFEVVRARELPRSCATRALAETATRPDVLDALCEYLSPEVARAVATRGVGSEASPLEAAGLAPEIAALFEPGPVEKELGFDDDPERPVKFEEGGV
jgi:hypothetical protein